MAVRFILGRSGTGKTHACIEAVCDALVQNPSSPTPLILLVPEQATFQMERAVLARSGGRGYHRLSVLSFDRLNFQLVGQNTVRARLSALGRQMVLGRLLNEVSCDLTVYQDSCTQAGFAGQTLHILDQLHGAAIGPEALEGCIERLESEGRDVLCAAKLRDIRVLLAAYSRFLEGRFMDPDRQFEAAREAVAKSEWLAGARIWVDGFAGFTQVELLMLKALMQVASHTTLALCLDPDEPARFEGEPDALDLFAPTLTTYQQLQVLIQEARLPQEKPILHTTGHRFCSSPTLAHIERSLFDLEATPVCANGAVQCVSATDLRTEVQFVARRIKSLVMDHGLRYRDVAVVASDLGTYEHLISAYFMDYDLPFFLDKQQPLTHHPGATLMASALRLSQGPMESSEIMAYMRSDLLGVDRHALDHLENYCLTLGVTSRDWQSDCPWTLDDPNSPRFDERAVNRTREVLVTPLKALQKKLQHETLTGSQFVQALRTFLRDVDVAGALEALIQRADQEGDPGRADRHRQFWDWLTGVLDECELILGDYSASGAFFTKVMLNAFSHITLALIPPTLDQILVGAIERSRHPEVKVVFLLGTTQKQFPSALQTPSLLSDRDRDTLLQVGLDLPGGLSQSLAQRRYLAYIAFTRASEQLIVTYPGSDEKGALVVRSQFMDDLEALFTDVHETRVTDMDEAVLSVHDLTDRLCSQGVTDWGSWQTTVADPFGVFRTLHTVTSSEASLDASVLSGLLGPVLHTSATRLSTYAACPFQYFAKYVLGLKARKIFGLEPLDRGNFYHRVLELFVQAMIDAKADWTHLDDENMARGVDKMIAWVKAEDAFVRNFEAHSPVNAYILQCACDVLGEAVPEIARAITTGQFRPTMAEAQFGGPDDPLGEFVLDLGDQRQVALHGKVDRIDVSGSGPEARAIVFDYKSTERSPDWTSLWYGLDLQLLVYVLALRSAQSQGCVQARSVGAFFISIEANGKKENLSTSKDKLGGLKRKAKGLFDVDIAADLDPIEKGESRLYNFFVTTSGEALGHYNTRGALESQRFERLLDFARAKIKALSTDILSGKVPVSPYRRGTTTPCAYCDYRALCRFDWQTHTCRTLDNKTKTEVLESLEVDVQ